MDTRTGRQQRIDARQNRDALLAVALQALTETPAISLNAIAKRAGVGNATLYRHFPTREALVLAVYHREVTQLTESATQLLAETEPLDALRTWIHALARYVITKRPLAAAMRSATGTDKGLSGGTYEALLAAITELVEANQAAGIVRPALKPDDLLLGLGSLWLLDPDGDWQGQTRRVVDLLMTGILSFIR